MLLRRAIILSLIALCFAVLACGRSAQPQVASRARASFATWVGRAHVRGIVDLSSQRADGSIVIAAAGRLKTLGSAGRIGSFTPAYSAPPGLEPYVAQSSGQRVPGTSCSFPANDLYALRLNHGDGVTVIEPGGVVRRFARLPSRGLENGIAFDRTGRFGHRLLVTSSLYGHTTVYAIDCDGRVRVLTRAAPRIEGGIAVAPTSFGHFAGDLIAPDEISGGIYAIAPHGRATLIARSGLAHGQDIGVESEGFVPARFTAALVADRLTRRNRHPGDDEILTIGRARLLAAGVRPDDLIAVTEGGADTVAVRCAASCDVHTVANGPSEAHIEGHIVFSASP